MVIALPQVSHAVKDEDFPQFVNLLYNSEQTAARHYYSIQKNIQENFLHLQNQADVDAYQPFTGEPKEPQLPIGEPYSCLED